MSDFGKLFRFRGAPGLEPLENFTTVALSIAVDHDARPILQALRGVDWTTAPIGSAAAEKHLRRDRHGHHRNSGPALGGGSRDVSLGIRSQAMRRAVA